ncbi:hypothetical protein GNX18_00050 [Microbulbifer sp. SH-1]|uniref:hypothetical protein n=1 Tax=Microbulbifer sp. SH-1 TaxID=2681547 RepID=UPI00140C0C31|nr:hypothetical protein [Microbulbifer sp. SH-1]QIL88341.1 hypothetical protein GNX18_00050 [Microbulbifer sp. SH-1]
MFNFKPGSGWSFETEFRCFIIYKRLKEENFPSGMQSDLCRVLAKSFGLSESSVKAKVGNYKSEFGDIGASNSSEATKFISENFGNLSVAEAEALLTGYLMGTSGEYA